VFNRKWLVNMIRGAGRKAETMSQDQMPEPKPDFVLKFWPLGIAARGIPGIIGVLVALVIVLTWVTIARPFGY
jgi:hypothetical protein